MDHLEQGSTSGPSQLDILRHANFSFCVLVWVELLLPPTLEMTTSVIVGILSQESLIMLHCMQMTHSGMVRAVDPLPAVS